MFEQEIESETLLNLLGNDNRRRILELLAHRPCYVSEISERISVAPKAVIAHLELLEDAGLIESFPDRQRRKYFHIVENFRIEVNISPFSFASEAVIAGDESAGGRELRGLFRNLERLRAAQARSDLGELAAALERLELLREELAGAQRYVQLMATEVTGRCIELIDSLLEDAVDAELLLSVARGVHDPRALAEALELEAGELAARARRLAERGLIKAVKNNLYLAGE